LSSHLNAPTHLPTAIEESNCQVERSRNKSTPVIAITETTPDCEPARDANITGKASENLTELQLAEHRVDLQTISTSQSYSSNERKLEQPNTSAESGNSQNRSSNPREGGQIEECQRKEQTYFWNRALPSRSSTFASSSRSISTFTSSVFSPISNSSSRSSIVEDSVDIPTDSRDIYYSVENGIYVGHLKEMPPPRYLENEWEASIKNRLIKDLGPVAIALPRLSRYQASFEPELRMVGEADPRSQNVIMSPTVLIRCGSKKCRKALQKAVNDLHYLQTFSRGHVQVGLHAPRPAGDSEKPAPDQSLENLDIRDLILQLRNDEYTRNVYGRRLRIISGANGLMTVWNSTIGGLIRVGDVVYALTTAHSIFEALQATAGDCNDGSISDDSDTDSEFPSVDPKGCIASSAQRSRPNIDNRVLAETAFAYQNADLALASYIGKSLCTHRKDLPTEVSSVTDFALIEWPPRQCRSDQRSFAQSLPGPKTFYNSYTSLTGKVLALTSFDEAPEEGEVAILYHPTELCTGWLLPGNSLFMQRDALFQTRKIQMRQPLGKQNLLQLRSRNTNGCRLRLFRLMGCSRFPPAWSDHRDL